MNTFSFALPHLELALLHFSFCSYIYRLFDLCLFHSRRELPFQKGDIVYIIRQVDQNWYEGEHHGRVGIFPQSYVEVCESELQPPGAFLWFFSAVLPHSLILCVCSSFHPQRKPSQRKASQYRCWNTGRPSPVSTSPGTQSWRCPSERCGVVSPSSASTWYPFFCLHTCYCCCQWLLLNWPPGGEDHIDPEGRRELVWGQNLRHQPPGHLPCHLRGGAAATSRQERPGLPRPPHQPLTAAQHQRLSSGTYYWSGGSGSDRTPDILPGLGLTTSGQLLVVPPSRLKGKGDQAFSTAARKLWNAWPSFIRLFCWDF